MNISPPTPSKKEFLCRQEIITQINRLMRTKSRSTLITMCSDVGIGNDGSKHDLATRLVMVEHKILEPRTSLMEKIKKSQKVIHLTLLPDGHFWYKDTGLVFHKETKKVFKRCLITEPVPVYQELDHDAINFCREHKIRYEQPETIAVLTKDDHNQDENHENHEEKIQWKPFANHEEQQLRIDELEEEDEDQEENIVV